MKRLALSSDVSEWKVSQYIGFARSMLTARAMGILLTFAGLLTHARAEDWPTFRHDQRRSGWTMESLKASELHDAWCWRSSLPPAPAWPDSARWDAYATLDGLRSMRDYDPVYHPVVVGERVYLPSNSDDTVRCLDLRTGQEIWRYTANAPVRIAPTVVQETVYFGCDDGCVVALDALTGKEIWSVPAAASGQTFINDGRMCSFEPIRSGVLIDPDSSLAIVSAGMFPWRQSYLVALSLDDGSLQWRRELGKGWSLEGAMLLASQQIIAPQGRAAPQLFQRSDGQPIGPLEGGGGSFVLLTDADEVLHGPGNKAGWITQSRVGDRERIATFQRARAIVMSQQHSFILDDTRLHSIDRQSNNVLWSIDCDCPHELILAGDTLFAGGTDLVRAFEAATGQLIWRASVDGRAMGMAVASGHLLVSTDAGAVHAFAAGNGTDQNTNPTEDHDSQLTETQLTEPKQAKSQLTDSQHSSELQSTEAQRPYAYPPMAPPPIPDADPSLLDRWVFHADQVIGVGKDNKRQVVQSLVVEPSHGQPGRDKRGNNAPLSERFSFVPAGREQALLLDGRTECLISADGRRLAHPTQQMTVMAWVRVDQTLPLGGIVSMMHSVGESASGWIVGFRDNQFALGLRCANGAEGFNWIQSPQSTFQLGEWYLVVATYDGTTARLFANDRLVASSAIEGGEVQYPERSAYRLGALKSGQEVIKTTGMLNEARVYNRAISEEEVVALYAEKADRFPEAASVLELNERSKLAGFGNNPIGRGPILEFEAPQTATVRWWTDQPQPSIIELLIPPTSSASVQVENASQPTTDHVAVIGPVRHHEVIKYRLGQQTNGQLEWSDYFECDGHFDFNRPSLPLNPSSDLSFLAMAEFLFGLSQHNEPRGLAIVVGAKDHGRLAEAVSRVSNVDIIALDADRDGVQTARNRLVETGLYGRSINVHALMDSKGMKLPNRTADFLVVAPGFESALSALDDQNAPNSSQFADEVLPQLLLCVQPGGRAVIPTELIKDNALIAADSGLRLSREDDTESGMTVLTVPQRAGSADWTHTYGMADNTAFAGETLSGASRQEDLTLVWAGRPGPRYQSDRGNRKPSPLSASGRLYMQGLKRIISLDAHNGTILWSLELPEVVRFNIPRDCSNWCVDEQFVYVAARDRCLVIDSASGRIVDEWKVLGQAQPQMDWGYLAREGDLLIGSSVTRGSAFTEFWGGEFWYDEKHGEHSKKVCSDTLFATDTRTGEIAWAYDGGLIVNPTITIADGRVTMLVCKSPELKQSAARRLDDEEFWSHMHLVALDVETGITLWDVPARPMEGKTAVYLAASNGKLVLVTSKDGAFGVYGLDAKTGENLWRGRFDWEVDHHGKHLSRPAIVDGKIYLRPLTLDLETGKVLSESFPEGHQCGTYSASRYALFLRAGELAVWDRNTGQSTRWDRVRPDCWLSTIPAQGMLLSPEGGGGCSCGGWIETSMAFAPTLEQSLTGDQP